jgi:hypothetical protein
MVQVCLNQAARNDTVKTGSHLASINHTARRRRNAMNIAPTSNSVAAQAVMNITSTKKTAEDTEGSATALASGDTVEISDEAYALSADAATATSESESSGEESGDSEAAAAEESGGAASTSSSSAASGETTEEDLEEEISALEQEIAALSAKAADNKAAQAQLEAKQTELMSLNSQLLQLQQNQ